MMNCGWSLACHAEFGVLECRWKLDIVKLNCHRKPVVYVNDLHRSAFKPDGGFLIE